MKFSEYINKDYKQEDAQKEHLDEARLSSYSRKDLTELMKDVNKQLTVLAIALDGKTDLDTKTEKAQYRKVKKFKDDLLDWSMKLDTMPTKE